VPTTEHMFFAEIACRFSLQAMIMATDEKSRVKDLLQEAVPMQALRFRRLLTAMDGLPGGLIRNRSIRRLNELLTKRAELVMVDYRRSFARRRASQEGDVQAVYKTAVGRAEEVLNVGLFEASRGSCNETEAEARS